jgi:hypothetical protein
MVGERYVLACWQRDPGMVKRRKRKELRRRGRWASDRRVSWGWVDEVRDEDIWERGRGVDKGSPAQN